MKVLLVLVGRREEEGPLSLCPHSLILIGSFLEVMVLI